jgi:hypothetical protein
MHPFLPVPHPPSLPSPPPPIAQSRRGVARPGSSLYGGDGGDEEFDEAVLADEPGGVRAARKAAERQRSAAGMRVLMSVCGGSG